MAGLPGVGGNSSSTCPTSGRSSADVGGVSLLFERFSSPGLATSPHIHPNHRLRCRPDDFIAGGVSLEKRVRLSVRRGGALGRPSTAAGGHSTALSAHTHWLTRERTLLPCRTLQDTVGYVLYSLLPRECVTLEWSGSHMRRELAQRV